MRYNILDLNDITGQIIGSAIEVHKILGPGLLESVYEECLYHELLSRSILVQRQIDIPLEYKGKALTASYRIDLLVEDDVIIELKACDKILPIHEAQLLTYLRLANKEVGLIINFNVSVLKEGIKRMRV
jgi:GxxExxY protein